MINLLPFEEKNRINLEKKEKTLIIFWFLFFYFLLCLFLVLNIINIYFSSKVEVEKVFFLETEKSLERSESKEIQAKIKKADLNLKKIDNFYKNKRYYTEILEIIAGTMPKEAYLRNLSITYSVIEEEEVIIISLLGFSPNEDILFQFRNNLIEKGIFEDIKFTAASWTNPNNFSISLKL